mgnify:CR=1 FL=1
MKSEVVHDVVGVAQDWRDVASNPVKQCVELLICLRKCQAIGNRMIDSTSKVISDDRGGEGRDLVRARWSPGLVDREMEN